MKNFLVLSFVFLAIGASAQVYSVSKSEDRLLVKLETLRNALTDEEKATEVASKDIVVPVRVTTGFLTICNTASIAGPKYLQIEGPHPDLHFNSGWDQFCIDLLIQHEDLTNVRHWINNEQNDGRSVRKKIEEIVKETAGVLTKYGFHTLGKYVMFIVAKNAKETE